MMFDMSAPAKIGESLAGLNLGMNLSDFSSYINKVIDGNVLPWGTYLIQDIHNVILYKVESKKGYIIYYNPLNIELGFDENQKLFLIQVAEGYSGKLLSDGTTIGSRIADIEYKLYFDDTDDVYYLFDDTEEIIEGIKFYAEENAFGDECIKEVKIY